MAEDRQRADRVTEERTERRRRKDTTIDGGQALKLAIPEEVEQRLKAERRQPRWVNDENNGIHRATVLDDYDKVEGVEPRVVGSTKDGKPILAHLCSKPIEFIEEDKALKDERRREVEASMLRGKIPGDPSTGPVERYVDEASSIQRARRSP